MGCVVLDEDDCGGIFGFDGTWKSSCCLYCWNDLDFLLRIPFSFFLIKPSSIYAFGWDGWMDGDREREELGRGEDHSCRIRNVSELGNQVNTRRQRLEAPLIKATLGSTLTLD